MITLVTFRMVENVTIRQDGVPLTQISLLANLIPEIDFLDQVNPHAATDPIFYIGEKFQISDGKLMGSVFSIWKRQKHFGGKGIKITLVAHSDQTQAPIKDK